MRRLVFILTLCFFPIFGFSQPDVPEEYRLETAADYETLKPVIIQSLKWLLKTPLEEEINLRAKHSAFVLIWLSGNPTVLINIDSNAMPFMETHENLFYTFMQGMALYQIDHPEITDPVKLHTYGMKSVAKMVERSHKIDMDSSLRKIMKAYRKNELKSYTEKLLNCG